MDNSRPDDAVGRQEEEQSLSGEPREEGAQPACDGSSCAPCGESEPPPPDTPQDDAEAAGTPEPVLVDDGSSPTQAGQDGCQPGGGAPSSESDNESSEGEPPVATVQETEGDGTSTGPPVPTDETLPPEADVSDDEEACPAIESDGKAAELDVAALVAGAVREDGEARDADLRDLGRHLGQLRLWSDAASACLDHFSPETDTQLSCSAALARSLVSLQALPEDCQNLLASRQETLSLIGKMILRLQERVETLREPGPDTSEELQSLDAEQLAAALQSDDTLDLEAVVKRALRAAGDGRYAKIKDIRLTAEAKRAACLYFVEKVVLPVVDGVDEGERITRSLLTPDRLPSDPAALSQLNEWLGVYEELRATLLRALESAHIHSMDVAVGTPVDYTLHEPFDVEADPLLTDESIKMVTRRGFVMLAPDTEPMVVRPAQVVVVRN